MTTSRTYKQVRTKQDVTYCLTPESNELTFLEDERTIGQCQLRPKKTVLQRPLAEGPSRDEPHQRIRNWLKNPNYCTSTLIKNLKFDK